MLAVKLALCLIVANVAFGEDTSINSQQQQTPQFSGTEPQLSPSTEQDSADSKVSAKGQGKYDAVSEVTGKKYKANLGLKVGKPSPGSDFPEASAKGQAEESRKAPTSDVDPYQAEGPVVSDKQPTGANVTEKGIPPKYPIKVISAEAFAHDNEIQGCRDHPNAMAVCGKCKNRCFGPEHESYTYSYCRKSCRYCDMEVNTFNKFWRLRAGSGYDPTWMLAEVEFYLTKDKNVSLSVNSSMAYASSEYSGYTASMAFDKDPRTMWFPSGWGKHDNNDEWIAYEFPISVKIHAVRVMTSPDHPRAAPQKVFVEAADNKMGPFKTKWTYINNGFINDQVYALQECPVMWHKFELNDVPYCYRIIAKYQTWEHARENCALEGGELASVVSKDELKFITDDLGTCGFTWLGLNDREQEGYFRWTDGSNTTYSNWKAGQNYDEVQRHFEDCTAMDLEGNWYTFACTDKFYSVCKQKLEVRPEPHPDEPPYLAEIPPMIFMAPNYTTPVENVNNLEPGVLPTDDDAEPADEEEEIPEPDELLLDSALENLEQKGLKPPLAFEALEEPPEDYEKTLDAIAQNATQADYSNETHTPKELPGQGLENIKPELAEDKKPAMTEQEQPNSAPVPGPNESAPPMNVATKPNQDANGQQLPSQPPSKQDDQTTATNMKGGKGKANDGKESKAKKPKEKVKQVPVPVPVPVQVPAPQPPSPAPAPPPPPPPPPPATTNPSSDAATQGAKPQPTKPQEGEEEQEEEGDNNDDEEEEEEEEAGAKSPSSMPEPSESEENPSEPGDGSEEDIEPAKEENNNGKKKEQVKKPKKKETKKKDDCLAKT